MLDGVLKPFQELLVNAVPRGSTFQVLDVGCGTGATTFAIARSLGASGSCTGIDISRPMIAAARSRARQVGAPARFIWGDAQIYGFEPSSFDLVISRFGVMFFDDSVQAFANLRRAARKSAGLRFIAWRSPAENPFMTKAERAAAPLLPHLPPRQPDAPGQFALADQRLVRRILEESGWVDVDIRPLDVTCTLPERELVQYVTRLGPLGRALDDADDRTRKHIIEAVRPAFDSYVRGAEVSFVAACWLVGARASK